MILVIFFGLIVLALVSSLLFGWKKIKNKEKLVPVIVKAIFINFLILGSGSAWWFLTETDGISQVIGVMIYLGSFAVISLINIVIIYLWNCFENG